MKDGGRFELGTALMTGGLIAASPLDELACVATGPFAPICAALAASFSTPIGLGAAGIGLYLISTSKPKTKTSD